MRSDKILNMLNSKQREAVEMPRVPILMLAGPGTGKTRTLIARIIYQINHFEIPPEHILALTFSNKAAQEIQTRLKDVLRDKADNVSTGTIHSFCLSILRKYYRTSGLDPHFTVANDEYQRSLLVNLIADRVSSNKEKVVRGILTAMDQYMLMNKPMPPFTAMIYDQYTEHLKKHKLVDYNQILTKTRDLLEANEDICEQYHFLYQAIHVDEFQDTDIVQYEIIKILAEKHRNIFVVADDDQSIYAWRGANPENIKTFMTDFNIDEPVFLDINYRSGQRIISTAYSVVKDTGRIEPDKNQKAVELINDTIKSEFFNTEEEEIELISEKIKEWSKQKNVPFAEIAVLYPQHRFADKLALKLVQERIPFQQATGKNLTDDPLMKKIILYLQAIRNPLDALILERLVESELGYHIHKQIQNIQKVMNIGYRRSLFELSNRKEFGEDFRRQLNTFIGNLANLINLKSFYSFNQLLKQVISGLQDLDKSYVEEHVARFTDFDASLNLLKKNTKVWLYHDNPNKLFISAQLLESVFPKRIYLLDDYNFTDVQKTDCVLLLSEFEKSLKATPLKLFARINEKRQSSFTTLLRWTQNSIVKEENIFNNYVVFDLETTGSDPEKCGIVEIAAVKVRDKQIVDEFQTLVNPEIQIEKEAQSVHNISNEDISTAPLLDDVWSNFLTFIGNDILVAHNGYMFDFRIIDRFGKKLDGKKPGNVRYDSLILARQMYPNDRNSIDALVAKFDLDPGNRHRALDDVKVLHKIFQKINRAYHENQKKLSGEFLFEYVALANFLDEKLTAYEDKVIFLAGVQKLVSPYSQILDKFCQEFVQDKSTLIEKLTNKARQLYPGINFYDSRDNFKQRVFSLAREFNRLAVDQAIAEFLSTLMLLNPQDNLAQVDAVSLMTFHAAKGLEFKKVIIMGMEDESMPSFFAYKEDDFDDRTITKKMDEQKRLLYVGLTRAKEEIIFTAVKNRFGRDQRSSPFLREILKFMKEND